MIFAIEIPNIGVVIDLLGCLAAVFIFIFPGVCLWQTTLTNDPDLVSLKSNALLLFAGFFLTIGAFLFGVVLTQVNIRIPTLSVLIILFQGIISNLSGHNSEPPLCVPSGQRVTFHTKLSSLMF